MEDEILVKPFDKQKPQLPSQTTKASNCLPRIVIVGILVVFINPSSFVAISLNPSPHHQLQKWNNSPTLPSNSYMPPKFWEGRECYGLLVIQ